MGLGAFVARRIWVSAEPAHSLTSAASVHPSTYLRDLPVGTRAYIVGYDRVFLGYCGKLLNMGLKPGTELRILRHDSAGQLVEVEVGGLSLRLAKPEADALCVETALPSP
ncbi:MAG: ferrous iron transport protein A [Chloroflexaceae bacterium]|nr:ferrous iron transport protein A [Chloroflexaceae bacterium]